MSKEKTIYVCQSCGVTSPKWSGRCTSCGEWNTLTEEIEITGSKKRVSGNNSSILQRPVTLAEIPEGKMERFSTFNNEFDRVLGGGLVPDLLSF
jgi:DNA repair protein RadA/Sms